MEAKAVGAFSENKNAPTVFCGVFSVLCYNKSIKRREENGF